jgi:hypothetical protein
MIVTFKTRAHYPDITMFGDVALQLLKLMGRRETLPSAIEAEDIPAALQQLRTRLADQEGAGVEPKSDNADDEGEAPIGLGTRAGPLIEMLEAAAEENVGVMWEEG